MIAHRIQTHPQEPAVKFYRTIAISFLALTVVLLGVVIFITSKKAVITVLAKNDVKNVSFNANLVSGPAIVADEQSVAGGVTSSLFFWKQKYSPTGNKIVDAIATGEAIIYNRTGADQTLVKTTRLVTPLGVLFRLTDRVTVPANGQITAAIYADLPGSSGEVGPSQLAIPGLSADKQKFIFAETKILTASGTSKVGVITEEDIKAAITDYAEKTKQAYLAANNSIFTGRKPIITLAGDPAANHNVGEEVSEFELSCTSTVVAIWYDESELAEVLNKAAGSKVDLSSEKALSFFGSPQVSMASYSLKNGTAQLTVAQNIMVTLDSNADKLAAGNFLGKSKDEIQRYILGLDHVAGVEVKFSPAWMMSAPSVPDRIQVIVKNVK